MNTKTTISITEGRKRLFDIANEVQAPNRVYTLTEKGRPRVAVMAALEYESLMETLEVMRVFPELDKDIAKAKKDVRSGAYKKFSTLETLKKDWGLLAASSQKKSEKKHVIRTSHNTKSKKGAR